MRQFLQLVENEIQRARQKHPKPINSPHEGYGILMEEVWEYFDEIRRQKHDPSAMLSELVQICAVAAKTAEDCGMCENGDIPKKGSKTHVHNMYCNDDCRL